MYFLNSISENNQFIKTTEEDYFVDKSELISKLNKLVGSSKQYVCITRPRRFGKSLNALMLASYYSNNFDTKETFDKLNISKSPSYKEHLNKHNVIFMSFNTNTYKFKSYEEYLNYFESNLISDIIEYCPDVNPNDLLSDMLNTAYEKTGKGFIFIIDEWDYIFDMNFSDDEKINFLDYLSNLLKDRSYVEFAYMTGILPIAKYFSTSFCNMFPNEHGVFGDFIYDHYFGFTESEVEELCKKQDVISIVRTADGKSY